MMLYRHARTCSATHCGICLLQAYRLVMLFATPMNVTLEPRSQTKLNSAIGTPKRCCTGMHAPALRRTAASACCRHTAW